VEKYLGQLDVQTTFLSCSFFMQKLSTTHRAEIKEHNEIFVPVGRGKTSFIDVRDIAAVATRVLTEDKNYALTGSRALDYWEAATILSKTLGKEIKYGNPNPLSFVLKTVQRGIPFRFAIIMTGLYLSTHFGMAKAVTADVEQLTGKHPISFERYTQDFKNVWL
jgi:uncharacterized protein YbjT (DUF2867 family)